ncbi:MAG: peptide chain release factor 1 [Candidatus Babeliales bacterium]
MAIDWIELKDRFNSINQQLVAPALEVAKRSELQKEAARLSELLEHKQTLEHLDAVITQTTQELESISDPELEALYQEELEALQVKQAKCQAELDDILYPPDDRDNRSVFLEIRAGTGGAEAALFAADLTKMYTTYALEKGWQVSLVDTSQTDLGGIREAVLHIQGKKVFGHLKREAGVHRVQRVPKTETSGRVHTSTATVAVLPEAKEVDISINPQDLRIDTYRASGAGGQHVNKTDSAVRITHIPTGVVVACQEERSQHKNKAKAMKMLQSRLFAVQQEKHEAQVSKERKEMVGTGMRSEKVRTYNFPQNRVTDHQVNVTLKKLDMVMQGELDEIIEALMAFDREERRKKATI